MLGCCLSLQFVKFLLVGATAAVLHWLARLALSQVMPFAYAVALAYVVGMAVAFELNRRFVFPASRRATTLQARDFVLTNLAFFPVVWGVSMGLRTLFWRLGMVRYVEGLAHAIAIATPVLATFLVYKFIAFKES